MVLMPEPLFAAVEAVRRPAPARCSCWAPAAAASTRPWRPSWPPSPAGFSLLCGRYEGVDQRVADHLVDGELSIGDFVLAGGEVAALVVVEAVARLVPGVMGNEASADEESFGDGLLEYPQYTRPADFRGWEVPEVLRSGDHGRVARWRRAQALPGPWSAGRTWSRPGAGSPRRARSALLAEARARCALPGSTARLVRWPRRLRPSRLAPARRTRP